MTKPNSILTDKAIDLLVEIIRVSDNHHAPQIVETALREYLRTLRERQEKDVERVEVLE